MVSRKMIRLSQPSGPKQSPFFRISLSVIAPSLAEESSVRLALVWLTTPPSAVDAEEAGSIAVAASLSFSFLTWVAR